MANRVDLVRKLTRIALVLALAVSLALALGACRRGDDAAAPGDSETSFAQEYTPDEDADYEQDDYYDHEVNGNEEQVSEPGEYDSDYNNDYSSDYDNDSGGGAKIREDGEYTTAAEVAEYIHTYHKLPGNYVSQDEAKKMGWHSNQCPAKYGIMIGGSKFGNREKLLPKGKYRECDVDYDGRMRGVCRLVYTTDGTVYYSDDHYESFTQLY